MTENKKETLMNLENFDVYIRVYFRKLRVHNITVWWRKYMCNRKKNGTNKETKDTFKTSHCYVNLL